MIIPFEGRPYGLKIASRQINKTAYDTMAVKKYHEVGLSGSALTGKDYCTTARYI